MSSSAGPSRVSRPRRSSEATSNGSTASSTGTADGARTGASGVLVSGDGEVMALYLGSDGGNRKGRICPGNVDLLPSPLVGEGGQRRPPAAVLNRTPMLCIGYAQSAPDEGSLSAETDPSPVRDANASRPPSPTRG